MQNNSKSNGIVPDPQSILSDGNTLQEMMEMNMLEAQVLQGYTPPGQARKAPQIEWVKNTLDGSILHDHKGYPVSVNRLLATKPLRSELSSRPGPGGKKLTYLSGEGVTRTLNEVFGFDGWDLSIVKTQREECVRDDKGRFHVSYTAQVRLTHKKSGAFKEDVGASDSIDKIMGTAVAHALKGSITDALKRAARHFGEKLGNVLYQGDFSISKAPLTLRDALDQYDKERSATRLGTATPKPGQENARSGVQGMPTSYRTVSIAKESSTTSTKQQEKLNVGTQQSKAGVSTGILGKSNSSTQGRGANTSNTQQSIATVTKTPSAVTAPRPVVSATPAAHKFRTEDVKPMSNPPKFQLQSHRPSLSSNNQSAPPPPPSAAERLRNQSNMFGASSLGSSYGNLDKENAMPIGPLNGPNQGNQPPTRPTTSYGRTNDPSVMEWSRQQPGGLKRPANSIGAPAMDTQAPNKRMNPYTSK